ncbi:hypothetical protein ABIA16_001262 [Sinorhizobium fredii]|nr:MULTISPECIES: hypothetical protein [Sinorhizobium]
MDEMAKFKRFALDGVRFAGRRLEDAGVDSALLGGVLQPGLESGAARGEAIRVGSSTLRFK